MLLNINLIIHFNCIKMFCHTIHYELYIHFLIDLKCFPFFTIMCNKFAHMPEFFLGINQGVRLLDQSIAHLLSLQQLKQNPTQKNHRKACLGLGQSRVKFPLIRIGHMYWISSPLFQKPSVRHVPILLHSHPRVRSWRGRSSLRDKLEGCEGLQRQKDWDARRPLHRSRAHPTLCLSKVLHTTSPWNYSLSIRPLPKVRAQQMHHPLPSDICGPKSNKAPAPQA